MKTCYKCNEEKTPDQFGSNPSKTDGLQSQCRECQKKYRREHYLKNRAKYIDKTKAQNVEFKKWWKEYKTQFACSSKDCKESHPACIQFHHPNDDKEENVARLVTNKCKAKVIKEIAKCISLCANCHAKLHWKE